MCAKLEFDVIESKVNFGPKKIFFSSKAEGWAKKRVGISIFYKKKNY